MNRSTDDRGSNGGVSGPLDVARGDWQYGLVVAAQHTFWTVQP